MPLLVMALAFMLLFFTLHLAAMRNEILRRRVRTMLLMQAEAAAGRRRHGPWPARHFHRRRLRRGGAASSRVLIAWVIARQPARRRARSPIFEARGVTRRSERAASDAMT